MKVKSIKLINLTCLIFVSYNIAQEKPPHVINFFFRPLIYTQKVVDKENLHRTISTPGAVSESVIEQNLLNNFLVSGIIVTYAGFWTWSNLNGEVILPRRNKRPKVKILVTQAILPIFEPDIYRPSGTIHHWEILKEAASKLYICQLKQDEDLKLYFWHISQARLPKNNIIPHDTIIIFGHPNHIILPTGHIKLGINTAHFLLPDIYVSPKVNRSLNSLRFLKIKKYFAPIEKELKIIPKGYMEQINI